MHIILIMVERHLRIRVAAERAAERKQCHDEFEIISIEFQRKIKILEMTLEESRMKENAYKDQQNLHASNLNEIQSRFDIQVNVLQSQLEEKIDQVNGLSMEIKENKRRYEDDKMKWEENEMKFKSALQDYSLQISIMNETLEKSLKDSKEQIEFLQKSQALELEEANEKINAE